METDKVESTTWQVVQVVVRPGKRSGIRLHCMKERVQEPVEKTFSIHLIDPSVIDMDGRLYTTLAVHPRLPL